MDPLTLAPKSARLLEGKRCWHQPQCPDVLAPDRIAARAVSSHPEQGWSLLCNGIVAFDDGGALLPDGLAVQPCVHREDRILNGTETAVSKERTMSMNITGQAQENREYVRRLLKKRQPDFAVVLELVVRELAECPGSG